MHPALALWYLSLSTMKSIIAPSALSSDFGHLTAECKRMIENGADWLHMGMFLPFPCYISIDPGA
jgi:hypothetical protein